VYAFLLVLLVLDGVLMSIVVLLQAGKGGGLAAMGGGGGGTMADQLIGGRQAATLLTKTTWITGGLFIGLSLTLSVMSSSGAQARSILQDEFRQVPTAPRPIIPGEPGTTGGEGGPTVPGTQPAGGTGVTPPGGN
jgi:preprotein translocase subunit SecG